MIWDSLLFFVVEALFLVAIIGFVINVTIINGESFHENKGANIACIAIAGLLIGSVIREITISVAEICHAHERQKFIVPKNDLVDSRVN